MRADYLRDELGPRELADALRRSASYLTAKAAVGLIIGHETWLHRSSFLKCVDADESEGTWYASVDWAKAARIRGPYSSSETTILTIAASIATDTVKVNLGEVSGLDATNTALVMTAIAVATGHGDMATGIKPTRGWTPPNGGGTR